MADSHIQSTESSKPLKVVLLCHSDSLGGAAVVTYRLMQALCREGVDAKMIVYSKMSEDSEVQIIGPRALRGWRFMRERLRIYLSNGLSYSNLFKVSTADSGFRIAHNPWIEEADVVVLTWINQGMMSLDGIRELHRSGKPLVWIMHDMWNFTGICHHSLGCDRYKGECGKCPFLGAKKENDLSRKIWLKKKRLYDEVPFRWVAVSNWLAERARESSLLGEKNVAVIYNAMPVHSFRTQPLAEFNVFNLDYSRDIILFGAARLDDPIKGLDKAIEALNYLFDNHPEVANNAMVVFFGGLKDKEALAELRFPHLWAGPVFDPSLLRQLYASAKIVLSSSSYETLPGTLIEGQAAGCLAVTFGRGGQSDIVEHGVNGFIADSDDPISLANCIIDALNMKVDRQSLHESVNERFGAAKIAKRFIALFEEITRKNQSET